MGFSRQENRSGLPFLSPNPRVEVQNPINPDIIIYAKQGPGKLRIPLREEKSDEKTEIPLIP